MIPVEAFAQAVERHEAFELELDGVRYVRAATDRHDLQRGAVLLEGRVLPFYPRIGRIFHLERGLEQSVWPRTDRVWAEEKIDGYNVRLVSAAGRILPFTRGGFCCPFTADRLRDLGDFEPFFDDHPDLLLCGEVAGPDNPYIPSPSARMLEGVGLFVFDVQRFDGSFLPPADRDRLLDRYGLRRAPVLGLFGPGDLDALRRVVLRLDREGAEGIVFKDPDGVARVKWVTPSSSFHDVETLAPRLAGLPPEYFVGRLVRMVVALEELGLSEDRVRAIARDLGEALVGGFRGAIDQFRETHCVQATVTVRLYRPESADALLAHLNRASEKIQVREVSRTWRDGMLELTFRKIHQQSTGSLDTILSGGHVYD